jgi:hypothetical protein
MKQVNACLVCIIVMFSDLQSEFHFTRAEVARVAISEGRAVAGTTPSVVYFQAALCLTEQHISPRPLYQPHHPKQE